jgi:hypothetical protein
MDADADITVPFVTAGTPSSGTGTRAPAAGAGRLLVVRTDFRDGLAQHTVRAMRHLRERAQEGIAARKLE